MMTRETARDQQFARLADENDDLRRELALLREHEDMASIPWQQADEHVGLRVMGRVRLKQECWTGSDMVTALLVHADRVGRVLVLTERKDIIAGQRVTLASVPVGPGWQWRIQ